MYVKLSTVGCNQLKSWLPLKVLAQISPDKGIYHPHSHIFQSIKSCDNGIEYSTCVFLLKIPQRNPLQRCPYCQAISCNQLITYSFLKPCFHIVEQKPQQNCSKHHTQTLQPKSGRYTEVSSFPLHNLSNDITGIYAADKPERNEKKLI